MYPTKSSSVTLNYYNFENDHEDGLILSSNIDLTKDRQNLKSTTKVRIKTISQDGDNYTDTHKN